MNKLVCGIGINENKYLAEKEGIPVKEHILWTNMLHRCTEKCWVKYPAYIGTTCSENFKSYTFFYEWCQEQIGFNSKDESGKSWNLDKDLLIRDNKFYSEDTCVFVPARINKLLTKRHNFRGKWPLGVCLHTKTGKFRSYCSDGNGKQIFLGLFATQQEAFLAYKTFKEALIKQVAKQYKDQLDPRVYQALLNYEVNIND
jgi:hypothetical protein